MRELSLVGPSHDGQRLLLVADDGTQFELPVDDRLASVVSREHRPANRPARTSGPVRRKPSPSPRDIQQRIRRGVSVEAIAAAANVPPEQIARFANPVITERAHIANLARQTVVQFGDDRIALQAAVAQRLGEYGLKASAVTWDAWLEDDGRWCVVAAHPDETGERIASFIYDSSDRTVAPFDDHARWLITAGMARPGRPDTTREPRSWDESHPAAKAQLRREASSETEPPAPSPESPDPAATTKPRTQTPAPAQVPQTAPLWEGLLFGTPTDDDAGPATDSDVPADGPIRTQISDQGAPGAQAGGDST
ncbi:MAG: septation protein SepH [Actinomycetes bacterium]